MANKEYAWMDAWEIIWKTFRSLIETIKNPSILLILFLLSLNSMISFYIFTIESNTLQVLLYILVTVIGMVFHLFLWYGGINIIKKGRFCLSEAFNYFVNNFLWILKTFLWFLLIFVGIPLILVWISIWIWSIAPIISLIGSILTVVVFIFLSVRLFCVYPMMIDKNIYWMEVVEKSYSLTRNQFGRIFGNFFLIGLILSIIFLIFSIFFLNRFLWSMMGRLFDMQGQINFDVLLSLDILLFMFINNLVGILGVFIIFLYIFYLYKAIDQEENNSWEEENNQSIEDDNLQE